MKVISGNNSRYLLQDLVTDKERNIIYQDMEPFKFHPLKTNPLDIARRDQMEFFVESILEHDGNVKNKKDLLFKVKWLTSMTHTIRGYRIHCFVIQLSFMNTCRTTI